MIGFSDIREESRERLYDVIAEQKETIEELKPDKFDPKDVGNGECARCHCGIKRNGGAVEFTMNGFRVKWDHLCLQCASHIKYHLFHQQEK